MIRLTLQKFCRVTIIDMHQVSTTNGNPNATVKRTMPSNLTGRRLGRKLRSQRAFTLVEVVLSLIVLGMMIIVVAACCPMILRQSSSSNYYAEAAMIAEHKIDQIRAVGFSTATIGQGTGTWIGAAGQDVSYAANLIADDIIDPGQTAGPYTFTTIDNLVGTGGTPGFFPAGTVGTVSITPDTNSPQCTTSPRSACDIVDITVKITFPSMAVGKTNTYTAVGKMVSSTK